MLTFWRFKHHLAKFWILKTQVFKSTDSVSIKVLVIINDDIEEQLNLETLDYLTRTISFSNMISKILLQKWKVKPWDSVSFEILKKQKIGKLSENNI